MTKEFEMNDILNAVNSILKIETKKRNVVQSIKNRNDKVDVFAAKVKGDSMIDALVADGDLVIMEPVDNPRNGDMVAAFLEDNNEVTLKHFYLQNGVVTLKPANPLMSPITVAAEKVAVRGRVVGVIRSMSNNVKYTGY